jgi:hypothetical protein
MLKRLDDVVIRPALWLIALVLVIQIVTVCTSRAQDIPPAPIGERVAAQGTEIKDLGRRLGDLEKMDVEHRLTAIEAKINTGTNMQVTSMLGTIGLLLEVLLRRMRGRPESQSVIIPSSSEK